MKHPTSYTGDEISAAINAGYKLAKDLPKEQADTVVTLCRLLDCYHAAVIRVRNAVR